MRRALFLILFASAICSAQTVAYSARTDDCALGTEAGCGSSPLAKALNFQMRPGDAPAFSPITITGQLSCPLSGISGATFDTGATDPDFGSHEIMISDPCTQKSTTDLNMGEEGERDVFNSDDSMVQFQSDGGGPFLVYLNVSYARSHICSPATDVWPNACVLQSQMQGGKSDLNCTNGGGSGPYLGCTAIDANGAWSWARPSMNQPNVLYELNANGLTINQLVICRKLPVLVDAICSGAPINNPLGIPADTFERIPYVNFANATNGFFPQGYNSNWNGGMVLANDGSVAVPDGGGPDWTASTQYYNLDSDTNTTPTSFIWPQSCNGTCTGFAAKYAFQATVTGVSNSTELDWTTTSPPTLVSNVYTPGTCINEGTGATGPCSSLPYPPTSCGASGTQQCVQWQNIGKINGQGPGFDVFHYSPSLGYTRLNTRILKIYRGAGNTAPSGSAVTDDNSICGQYNGTVGPSGQCEELEPFTETFTLHAGGSNQNPGFLSLTSTGGGSNPPSQDYSPSITSGVNYNNGGFDPVSLPSNAYYMGQYSKTATYAIGDAVYSDNLLLYVCTSSTACSNGEFPQDNASAWAGPGTAKGPVYSYEYEWQVDSLIIRPCTSRSNANDHLSDQCSGHKIHGYLNFWSNTGLVSHFWSQPCTVDPLGPGCLANPGITTSPGIPGDDHGTCRDCWYTPYDSNPIGDVKTQVPEATYGFLNKNGYLNGTAGYGEFVAFNPLGLASSCNPSSGSFNGTNCFERFFHIENDSLQQNFSAQNNLGVISSDGQWAVLGTDEMGTRGSLSGTWPGPCTQCVPLGTAIFPQNTSGSCCNTLSFDYVATAIGGCTVNCTNQGTPGSEPDWDLCSGSPAVCLDGTGSTQITWTRQSGSCNTYRSILTYGGIVYSNVSRYQPSFNPPAPVLYPGDIIYPANGVAGQNIFMALNEGVPNVNPPSWAACTAGSGAGGSSYGETCTDGAVTMVNIGPSDCRTDIKLVDLLSAGSAGPVQNPYAPATQVFAKAEWRLPMRSN